MTSLPFWLSIVSTAIVVFPVCRSPIISSLCPLPIGIMLSMDSIPVSSGRHTGFLAISPGAGFSSGAYFLPFSALPSSGAPMGLMTLPMTSPETTVSTGCPVPETVSPMLTAAPELRMTAPTPFSSRSSAIPHIPPPNFKSSP